MNILDNISAIKSLDKKNALGSIKQLPQQIAQSWQEGRNIVFPESYKNVTEVVICGMGGSTYGGRIVKSLYDGAQYTKIPVELANGYYLPGYVDSNTLVILSSYSGSTEETLITAKEAQKKGAKITGITSGGKLLDFLESNNYPAYIFNPTHNPSGQPRLGVGYMVTGLIGMLVSLGKIPVGKQEIETLISFLTEKNSVYGETIETVKNPAKQMALKLENKIPIIIVADFLEGAAYAIRNPFHETAKQLALYFTIPELNHHLMEGLSFPKQAKSLLQFIFVKSQIYDRRNTRRMELTLDVVHKNGIGSELIELHGSSALAQTMELIQIGSWTTFYLSMLHEIDPSEIPWVDYFKKELTKEE